MESNKTRLEQEKEGSRRVLPRGKKKLTDRSLDAFDNNKQSFATWKRVRGCICDSYMEQIKI